MVYIHTGVEVDVNELIWELGDKELLQLADDILKSGYIPDGWIRRSAIDLSDGATLLQVIVELRRLGYIVEPGGK